MVRWRRREAYAPAAMRGSRLGEGSAPGSRSQVTVLIDAVGRGRADDDRPRAWCINDACDDGETGQPAQYEGSRLYLLTENRAS